jgi:hypothetical protein
MHPTGNVTGVLLQQNEQAAERVEIMKEAFPNLPAATEPRLLHTIC